MKIFISVKNPNLLQKKKREETQHSFPRSKEKKKIERLCGKKTVIKHVEHLAVSKPISH